MQLIDGYNGGIPHIDAQMIRDHNISLYGEQDWVLDVGNKFSYEIVSNNEIKILDGYAVMQGIRLSIAHGQHESATIKNGISGYNRNDIICFTYTKNENTLVETVNLEVVKGATGNKPRDPTVVTGNIRGGAINHQMPLYRVRLAGTNIAGVDMMFSLIEHGIHDSQKRMFDVGDIYTTTNPNMNTAAKVAARYGGQWELFGQGRVLVGVNPSDPNYNAPNKTGGSKTNTLNKSQIPELDVYLPRVGGSGTGEYGITDFGTQHQSRYKIGFTEQTTPIPVDTRDPYVTVYRWRKTSNEDA